MGFTKTSKKLNKAMSLILAVIMLVALSPATLFAAYPPMTLTLGNETCDVTGGGFITVDIPVNLTDIPSTGITGGIIYFDYDDTVFTYNNFFAGDIIFDTNMDISKPPINSSPTISIVYTDYHQGIDPNTGFPADTHITSEGLFGTLRLKVDPNAVNGNYTITMSGPTVAFYTETTVAVDTTMVSGSVTITGGVTPSPTPSPTNTPSPTATPLPTNTPTPSPMPTFAPVEVDVTDASGLPGTEVEVDINLSNIPASGITAGQIEVEYDKTKMDLTDVIGGSILNNPAEDIFWTDTLPEGAKIIYSDYENAGLSNTHILNNGQFCTLKFMVDPLATPGDVTVTVTDPDVAYSDIPFYTMTVVPVYANYTPGTVNILDPNAANIIPEFVFDMPQYVNGDTVKLDLRLKDTFPGDKTNSISIDVAYDGDAFRLLTPDVNTDIVDGYIPYTQKYDVGSGSNKRAVSIYVDMSNDVPLQEGEVVWTGYFKVRSTTAAGDYDFTLAPVIMLDSDYKVYNVNNGDPLVATTTITNEAVVEGYLNIFLGDIGSGLNNTILADLSQDQINEAYSNLQFTLKQGAMDPGTVFTGADVMLPDLDGNLAKLDSSDGMVKGKFRIYTNELSKDTLRIDGVGYLMNDISITLSAGMVTVVSDNTNPTIIYPGDVGHINIYNELELTPEGSINVADFSAWLQLYEEDVAGTIAPEDALRADFTKDTVIDSIDFSLWMNSYEKVLLGL